MSKHKVFWDLLTDALLLFHIHLRHWSLLGINEYCLWRGLAGSHVGRKQFPRLDLSINAKIIPHIYSSLWIGFIPLLFPKDYYIKDVREDPDWKYSFQISKFRTNEQDFQQSSWQQQPQTPKMPLSLMVQSALSLFVSTAAGWMKIFMWLCLCSSLVLWFVYQTLVFPWFLQPKISSDCKVPLRDQHWCNDLWVLEAYTIFTGSWGHKMV